MARGFHWTNTARDWGAIARSLHWLIAVLIAIMFTLAWIADDLPSSPKKFDLFVWHKSIGITVLSLVLLRVLWRAVSTRPDEADGLAVWQKLAAKAAHALLYLLMFAVPMSGWWVSDTTRVPFRLFGNIPMPDLLAANHELHELAEEVHEALTWALLALVAVHVLAALHHHFMLKNDTLVRMLPFRRSRAGNDA